MQEEKRGQPSIPPGVYFRMLLVGYFEGIDSQRGIAWQCADSLSLRQFLGIPLDEATPDPKTLSNTRHRLPEEVFDEVFQFVLRIAAEKKLLSGKTVGVDSTLLEANAAMKSIVRRDTGEDWKQFVTRLMREEGAIDPDHEPTDEEVRTLRQTAEEQESVERRLGFAQRSGKPHHADERRPHPLGLQGRARRGFEKRSDPGGRDLPGRSRRHADAGGQRAGSGRERNAGWQEIEIKEIVADKGYHAAEIIELANDLNFRTYIPERRQKHHMRWTDKPTEFQQAVYANRRRLKRAKSRQFQRPRSERCERTFAHVCDTGAMRRSWLKEV